VTVETGAVNVVAVVAVTVTASGLLRSLFAIRRTLPTTIPVIDAGVTVCDPMLMFAAIVVCEFVWQ